jgi:hypothetical protein
LVSEGDAKRCSRCRQVKPRAAFDGNRSARDGLQAYCRSWCAELHQARQSAKGMNVRPRVETPEGHTFCRSCGEVEPHAQRHRDATASDGLSTSCRTCRAAKGRAGRLKRQYGMTEAQREEMVASRMGLCVICLKAPAVHVDHCHETGRVRGVLCFNCNSAIGKLGDDPDAVRRAAAYLEGTSWKPTLVAPGVYQLPS